MNCKDKVIIITGASSGIGRELAVQLFKRGSKLVLAARNEGALRELAEQISQLGGEVIAVKTDVSQKDQVEALVEKTMERFGRLDVMINNAGVSLAQGTLMENKEEDVRATMEINFMGCVYGTWAAVPAMEKGGGGQMVYVSSIIGKRGVPRNAVYCASKFALQGLTESIRPELKKKNIHVLTLCPPGVNTPFFENNGKGEIRNYRLHPVEKIAKMMVRAMEKEKREVLLTMDSKVIHNLNFFVPGLMEWGINKVKKF